MRRFSRRSVLRGSVGLAAAGALARPFVANAAAKTASVWWVQGFIREEDAAVGSMVAEYERASGNTIGADKRRCPGRDCGLQLWCGNSPAECLE
jgi:hypothetical protein